MVMKILLTVTLLAYASFAFCRFLIKPPAPVQSRVLVVIGGVSLIVAFAGAISSILWIIWAP